MIMMLVMIIIMLVMIMRVRMSIYRGLIMCPGCSEYFTLTITPREALSTAPLYPRENRSRGSAERVVTWQERRSCFSPGKTKP